MPVAVVVATGACGYHTVYGHETEHLRVVLVRSSVPDAVASDEVTSGVREALAREGALAAGEGYPRVEIEVLRADEESEGVAVSSGALGGSATNAGATGPRARGSEVGLVARACLVRSRGGACERDTGDVRAEDLTAVDLSATGGTSPVADAFHHGQALRAVGRRLGERLARHLLGEPGATDDGAGF